MAKGAGGITHRYNLDKDAYFKETSLAAAYSDNRPKVEQLLGKNSSYYFACCGYEKHQFGYCLKLLL